MHFLFFYFGLLRWWRWWWFMIWWWWKCRFQWWIFMWYHFRILIVVSLSDHVCRKNTFPIFLLWVKNLGWANSKTFWACCSPIKLINNCYTKILSPSCDKTLNIPTCPESQHLEWKIIPFCQSFTINAQHCAFPFA